MNDYDSRLNSLGTFLAGLVLGSLIGAAMAMLMAPSSGPETRRLCWLFEAKRESE